MRVVVVPMRDNFEYDGQDNGPGGAENCCGTQHRVNACLGQVPITIETEGAGAEGHGRGVLVRGNNTMI